jgi:hypothetical protein
MPLDAITNVQPGGIARLANTNGTEQYPLRSPGRQVKMAV